MERDVPELPEVICERMERGRRVRRGFEVIEGLEGPPSEKVIRLNPPSAAFASVSEREDREGANARGTKETTLSLFQRPYRTLGWKAQSSSWAGSVNERERSGISESRERQAISPVTAPVTNLPSLFRTKSSDSVTSKSAIRGTVSSYSQRGERSRTDLV